MYRGTTLGVGHSRSGEREEGRGEREARVLPQHSDVQTSKHPDLSPSVRFSPPPLLELEYHLFSSVVSFSISFYDLVASPLYLLLHRVSPSSPFAQTIPKRLCRRLMPMLACAGNNDLPSSLSLPLSISIYSSLSLSLSLFPCISCFLVGSLGFRCIYKDTRMGERKR